MSAVPPGPLGPLTWLRTILFYIHIALATLVIGLWGLPRVLRDRRHANRVATVWLRYLLRCARWHLGLTCEVRGRVPGGDCLVAAKHQSFWDILCLAHALPERAFIMKREVLRVPVMGAYARAIGSIPIDRSRGGEAMTRIGAEVRAAMARPEGLGQLIIYPEGTRTRPGERRRYKHGVASLAGATGLPVVPVAVNVGLFWSRKGFPIRSGRSVIEFLDPLPPELRGEAVTAALQARIEPASDRLMAEAGFVAPQRPG
ncbi:1-acyl-sn-glycerol-3-phosphate acyltransferase [Paracoccus sp. S-4012]|uniref:lysophospholipid acyltransferase family protein n=1 Tax=Paracoccus sp. S-4012 TaxID=2665648 RepID=UPI0012AFF756|nr:lysophospholipid acyltransferase family protein [Paracoccus sp. S-4012]MRX49130.1 1-acyl-sn-glycerol-3-phosphate acyltransferase [Paracoccus sp. S-4012]